MKIKAALLVILAVGLFAPSLVGAAASENFFRLGRDIVDDWGVVRTRAGGINGFLGVTSTSFDPIIVRESLGEHGDIAWRLGEEFARKYPDRNQRAERIFIYVRDRVVYASDSDQFGTPEFAQNADEVAKTIVDNGSALGDCEDSAVLLAVMYRAAGYRSAMVLMPGHVATLVYLPEYKKAARKLNLAGEGGWVWAEATGATNPFGWVPESLISDGIVASEVTEGPLDVQRDATSAATVEEAPVHSGDGGSSLRGLLLLVMVVGILWLMAGGRGAKGRARGR
jgi:hypothetical protein